MTVSQPAQTDGFVLLGWKTRDRALTLLQQECDFDPPLTDDDAEKMWARYREHVNALRGRVLHRPDFLSFTKEEQPIVGEFLEDHTKQGGPVREVVKINPLDLVVHQLEITTARSMLLSSRLRRPADWAEECLCPPPSSVPPIVRHAPNSVDVDLPHGEWALLYDPKLGLVLGQAARCITLTTIGPHLVLWSGYHRTFACAAGRPEGERTVLAAMLDDVGVASAARWCGLRAVQSDNPPIFADFFNARLACPVRFRAKRFTMQIRAKVVAADA